MAYTTVTGGQEAIAQSHELVKFYRVQHAAESLSIDTIQSQLRLLVDRIMSESSLYAPSYAALALKQAQGDPAEATFLLCAYRSTLPRNYYSTIARTSEMRVIRRISSSFKDIPGGQMLGPTFDYTHRLLDFSLASESMDEIGDFLANAGLSVDELKDAPPFSKVIDLLRDQGLMAPVEQASVEQEPFDVTREKLKFPISRSARLQLLARGESGALTAIAYSSMRGFGIVHPTIGELRVGYLPIAMPYPYGDDEELFIGEVLVTEVEAINSFKMGTEDSDVQFSLGYGLVFGQNETKAISMAILERSLETPGTSPAQDEEFVLLHIDSLESNGFVSHLKLPHYTTFQASLDRIRSVKGNVDCREEEEDEFASIVRNQVQADQL